MGFGKILVGVAVLLLAYLSIKQANPQAPDYGAFLVALLITAAVYEWLAKKIGIK